MSLLTYSKLCKTLFKIEAEPSTKLKKAIFLQTLNSESPSNIGLIVQGTLPSLLSNQFASRTAIRNQYSFDNVLRKLAQTECNLAESEANKNTLKAQDIADLLAETVSYSADSSQTVEEVIEFKKELLALEGNNSQAKRVDLTREQFRKCASSLEIRFLAKFIVGKMKIGFSETQVVNVLKELEKSRDSKSFKPILESVEPLFRYKIFANSSISPLIPFRMNLCRPSLDAAQIYSLLSKKETAVLAEFKYDGERTQFHFDGKEALMFSRNMESQIEFYSTLSTSLKADLEGKLSSLILDGEIIAEEDGKMVDFTELRKKETGKRFKIKVFDVLYLNGDDVSKRSLTSRKELLPGICALSPLLEAEKGLKIEINADFEPKITKLFEKSKENRLEGLVLKEIKEEYAFGKRNWFKVLL